ncbi:GTP-binding protein [Lysinibacillus contaminans]|uniref:GTP-binding protein n=1 Tax=Lysinibacillus contaminans TaxID=1293441 RepID=A0ABR5K0M4_9BACI|nr:dynamin family protein [Lysinibacillus contaminans]KOS68290.1 GTP-binding protein [Lysinibacillus contaminans]
MTNLEEKLVGSVATTNNVLPQLVDNLRKLHGIIIQNTYVKDTSKHLDRIIQDANNQTMVLIIGKERVGKTTLVNGLLGRTLLSVNDSNPTGVNTFLRYGEREKIKAYFLDGVIAVFDISKLELLTTGDTFASQILREHLDYLEVYVKHDLLKSVTIIDSVSLEAGNGDKAYFSESLINRVDEIFWVLRSGSMAIDAEIKLMEVLKNNGKEPLCVVNAIDMKNTEPEAFIATEKGRIGHLVSDFVTVSAKNALEAQYTENEALWQQSQYSELIEQINRVATKSDKKTSAILIRFLQWLERFRFELTVIPQRDPFKSAVENIEKYTGDSQYEFSRYQRDLAIVGEYEHEYKQVTEIFTNVHTLYQLLQTIEQYDFLQDPIVNAFSEKAISYQQMLREYRSMHSEYIREYDRLDVQHKKIHGKGLIKAIFGHHTQNEFFKERVDKLNDQQENCVALFEKVRVDEMVLLENISETQNYLMNLTKNRLSQVEQKVQELNDQRAKEKLQLKSYASKLNEFTCLIEAQGYLNDAIEPFLMDENLPLRDKDRVMLKETINSICAIDLSYNGLLARSHMKNQIESKAIPFDFEEKYPLHALALTELDIKSNDIPEIPKKLVVQYGSE